MPPSHKTITSLYRLLIDSNGRYGPRPKSDCISRLTIAMVEKKIGVWKRLSSDWRSRTSTAIKFLLTARVAPRFSFPSSNSPPRDDAFFFLSFMKSCGAYTTTIPVGSFRRGPWMSLYEAYFISLPTMYFQCTGSVHLCLGRSFSFRVLLTLSNPRLFRQK